MITYAAAGDAMFPGGDLTPAGAEAVRKAKLRNMELACTQLSIDNEAKRLSLQITRELLKEKVINMKSVHLPFYGDKIWDPYSDTSRAPDRSARGSSLIQLYQGSSLKARMRNF